MTSSSSVAIELFFLQKWANERILLTFDILINYWRQYWLLEIECQSMNAFGVQK